MKDSLLLATDEDAPCLEPGEKCDPANNQCCLSGGSDKCEASPWTPDNYICRWINLSLFVWEPAPMVSRCNQFLS